jgi:hypothetical protein
MTIVLFSAATCHEHDDEELQRGTAGDGQNGPHLAGMFDGINFIGYKQSAPALNRLDRR